MTVNVTRYRFHPQLRMGGLALGALGTISFIALGFVPQLAGQGIWSPVAAGVAFAGIYVGLEHEAVRVALRDMDQMSRKAALDLAWQPLKMPDILPLKWGAIATLVATILFVLSAADAIPRAVGVLTAAVIPAGVAFVRAQFVARPLWTRLGTRGAGKDFVAAHALEWVGAAAQIIGDDTLKRFRQRDPNKKAFGLWIHRRDSQTAPDMPARYTYFMSIAVGEFLGMRVGPYLDLKATAEAHAQRPDPDGLERGALAVGEDNSMLKESEMHYRDIVGVDYRRGDKTDRGEDAGAFTLSLSNGDRETFVTLESGPPVKAAIENIRDRTRRAKAG